MSSSEKQLVAGQGTLPSQRFLGRLLKHFVLCVCPGERQKGEGWGQKQDALKTNGYPSSRLFKNPK